MNRKFFIVSLTLRRQYEIFKGTIDILIVNLVDIFELTIEYNLTFLWW